MLLVKLLNAENRDELRLWLQKNYKKNKIVGLL